MSAAPPPSHLAPRRALPAWPWWLATLALVALLVVYPPFRFVPRGASAGTPGSGSAPDTYSAPAQATRVWNEQLPAALARAPEATAVLGDLRRDFVAAVAKYGHRAGPDHPAHFALRGSGRVVALERSRVLLDVGGSTIALRTGPVFGNVIRDGCGFLELNQAPGLAEFNALSAELNRLVEERVQPALRLSAVGATVEFAGYAEAPEALPHEGALLTVIPVRAEVKP